MARRPFIAGNWKLNLGPKDATALAEGLRQQLPKLDDVTVAVFPTALSVTGVISALQGAPIGVGLQEITAAPTGAFTGTNSAQLGRQAGCEYCLVGHSERRQLFGETDSGVAKKLLAAIEGGLLPILCIGETLEQRKAGRADAVVHSQLAGGLARLQPDQVAAVTVAYEPVWAIGTGETATPQQAQDIHASIRAWLRSNVGSVADDIRIQYGGSVKPANAAELLGQPDIDGALVGGASLTADSFAAIVQAGSDSL